MITKKQPQSGFIPEGWNLTKLGEVIEYQKGKKPSVVFEKKEANTLPYLTAGTLRDGIITQWGKLDGDVVTVNEDDLVLIWDGYYCGDVFTEFKGILSSTMVKIEPKESVLNEGFLFYFIKTRFNELNTKISGMYLKHVNKSVFKRLKVPIPPFREQQKIAEVLSTVDDAIRLVDLAITRTERLKKGLMQKLLTEGIGHTEFKQTKIGKTPKTWHIVRLGDERVVELIMGQSPSSSTYNKKGIGLPFLQGKAEFGEIFPSPRVYCSEPIKIAKKGDILLSVRAPVGDVNIVSSECCIGRGLSAIRTKENKLHHRFLFYYLRFSNKRFEALSMGSTFKAIRKGEIERYKIPLPLLQEQRNIAEILSTFDNILKINRKRKGKLERIKTGLMNDLLTGRRRVRVGVSDA